MKKIIFGFLIIAGFASCKKETKDVSKVYDATISKLELIGDAIYSPPAGSTSYVDPGATFTDDDGTTRKLTTPISLPDLSTPGFYSVQYKQTSIHGWVRTASRLVLVSKVDPSVDLSGTYVRGTAEVTVTKLGTGLYTISNVGGVAGRPEYVYDVYFGQLNDSTLRIPEQDGPLGPLSGSKESVRKQAGKYTLSWYVVGNTAYNKDVLRIFGQK